MLKKISYNNLILLINNYIQPLKFSFLIKTNEAAEDNQAGN